MRSNFLTRIYRLKLLVLGLTFLVLSILLSLAAEWLVATDTPGQVIAVVNALADVLLVTGAIGLAVDFFTGRDKDAADTERTRAVLKELTPDFTDAVLTGLAVDKSDLERIASPELLDDIATNTLSLRLGDDQFAREIYADIRDQAIRAPERWYDVDVSIRLSSLEESDHEGASRFDVLVKWEYTVVPSHPVQKFACFSDRQALRELIEETPSLIPWFLTPRPGFDARERTAFELLDFRVDGEQRTISRATRKHGQIYSARIGDDVLSAGKPVRISYVYRALTPRSGHRLFFEITQPTRGLDLTFDYTATDIGHLSVTDLVTSALPARVAELPPQAEARTVSVQVPGWLLPRAGFAFVWTLVSEQSNGDAGAEPTSSGPAKDAA